MTGPTENSFETLAALDRQAREQRQRLIHRARIARDRLRPANLAHEAGNRALDLGLDAMDKARNLVRAHPMKAVGVTAAAGAWLARKPLMKWLAAGYARLVTAKGRADPAAEESED